jgi:hypothetical protein
MKVIDTPRTGKKGNEVAYQSPFGQCLRQLVAPKDIESLAKQKLRSTFGYSARYWGMRLTETQRLHWEAAAQLVPSYPSLRQYGHLSGEQLWMKIDTTLRYLNQPPTAEPPAPAVFSNNPTTALIIDYDEQGAPRLQLNLGLASEHLMVFGQPPCSPGRMKHRRVYYLALLDPGSNGLTDITAFYTARFGPLTPGRKIFIITNQTKNGWKGQDTVVSAIVPPPPPGAAPPPAPPTDASPQPVAATPPTAAVESSATPPPSPEPPPPDPPKTASAPPSPPESSPLSAKPTSSLPHTVYKGGTPDAHRLPKVLTGAHPLSSLCTPLVHVVRMAWGRLGALGRPAAGASRGLGWVSGNCG